MAESAVNFLIQYLGPLLVDEAQSLKEVDGEVRELINELESIQSFLRDADARQDTNKGLKTWVKQIKEVAYDIEDVLDEFMLGLAQEQNGSHGFVDFLHRPIKRLKARHQIASLLRDIKTRICKITERKDAYALNGIEQGSSSNNMSDQWYDPRLNVLFIEEAHLVGIDMPRSQLIRWLMNGDSRLSTISVVGMGGLGKTTLVKKVYDSQQVKKRFQTYAWITVSQSFKLEDLLRNMIKQFFKAKKDPSPQGVDAMTHLELIKELRSYLQNKRYVLVLDDVWEAHVWNFVSNALPTGEYGSWVMITTRKGNVASSSNIGPSNHIYNLQPLHPENAWSLFCRKAFQSNEENSCPQELEKLSQSFVKKCQGLPLAIVALGSLLSIKGKTYVEWEMIHRSLGSELESDDNLRRMMKILLLSFNDLPFYLKSCFLYLSIFPEDYPIKRMKLIRLWIAEGFVETKIRRSKEEVAEGYLNELIARNLIQVAKRKLNGNVVTCCIHDLVREMIIPKFREEHFFASSVEENTTPCNRIRRRSIYKDENFPKFDAFSCLRSLFIFGAEGLSNAPAITSFSSLRLLKVVDLENMSMEIFPDDLTSLLHLRYLSLENTKIKKLPSSLGRLKNLETLNIKGTFVCELPVEILKLKCLCHLLVYRYSEDEFDGSTVDGSKVPAGIGSMISLQKLAFIEAESGIIRELGNLTQLRRLGIIKLRVEDGNDLCTSIEKMIHLHSFNVTSMDEEEVLDLHSLSHPPLPLQCLYLRGRLEKLPEWIGSLHNLVRVGLICSRLRDDPLKALQSLPNLVELVLDRAYDGEELRCEGRGYPRLKQLWLIDLSGLKKVRVEKGAMSSLEMLDIRRCEELVEASLWLEHVTNLKELYLFDTSEAFLKGLRKDGAEELVDSIRHIPLIRYTDTQRKVYWDLS
ncbi:disease resistance protein RPM1-like [Magnolia sinica]|uniref:disease resistance protein RPM1-like n=1 Tax=Magnolia sinica TaxID=86752 RepID=UPI00265B3A52|nr:disease resistance protein RPM1-like [Magnolia sinica]XP_058112831.1 disease resistance protein RPM1-like [Magnolia sinica]XP_058112832.1 disease resistance protein RPM1-like [Magnolia sinica]XP_058112833.1 disease resistance protein RPM1-like [Magnolia sinica]XP_058112834.1 disease resistance protein RPM1-like [Magnolia sinica]